VGARELGRSLERGGSIDSTDRARHAVSRLGARYIRGWKDQICSRQCKQQHRRCHKECSQCQRKVRRCQRWALKRKLHDVNSSGHGTSAVQLVKSYDSEVIGHITAAGADVGMRDWDGIAHRRLLSSARSEASVIGSGEGSY
jgi:hypothetical protein